MFRRYHGWQQFEGMWWWMDLATLQVARSYLPTMFWPAPIVCQGALIFVAKFQFNPEKFLIFCFQMKTFSSGEVTVRAEWNTGSPQVLIEVPLSQSKDRTLWLSLAIKSKSYLVNNFSNLFSGDLGIQWTQSNAGYKIFEVLEASRCWHWNHRASKVTKHWTKGKENSILRYWFFHFF